MLTGSRRCFGRRFALLVCARAESVCDRSACCSVRDRRTVRRRGDMAPRPLEIRAKAKNARALPRAGVLPPRAFPRPATVRARTHARTYSTNQSQSRGRRRGIRATAAAESKSDRVVDSIAFFFVLSRRITSARSHPPCVSSSEDARVRHRQRQGHLAPARLARRVFSRCDFRFTQIVFHSSRRRDDARRRCPDESRGLARA